MQGMRTPPFAGGTSAMRAKQPLLSRKGWLLAGAVVLLAITFVLGIISMIGNSEVCQMAVERAQADPAALQLVGIPVERGFLVSGSIQISGPSGHADLAIPIHGSKARGTIYAVAVKSAGLWQFKVLELAVKGRQERIDLLAASN